MKNQLVGVVMDTLSPRLDVDHTISHLLQTLWNNTIHLAPMLSRIHLRDVDEGVVYLAGCGRPGRFVPRAALQTFPLVRRKP